MFVWYLGGGIGHLEQFPPANNDNEVTYEYDDEEEDEMATDESEARRFGKNGGGECHKRANSSLRSNKFAKRFVT